LQCIRVLDISIKLDDIQHPFDNLPESLESVRIAMRYGVAMTDYTIRKLPKNLRSLALIDYSGSPTFEWDAMSGLQSLELVVVKKLSYAVLPLLPRGLSHIKTSWSAGTVIPKALYDLAPEGIKARLREQRKIAKK
jgi:hypothetical protein